MECINYFNTNLSNLLKNFSKLLSIPSISASPGNLDDCFMCSKLLQDQIKQIFSITSWQQPNKPPIIFASNLEAGPSQPTLLLYNHYDVQPANKEDGWDNDPFQMTQINDSIIARGASDNKGQCFYTLEALKYYYAKHKKFPINIKWLIEGEEESGSTSLYETLHNKSDLLKADYLLIIDGGFTSPKHPSISVGARGIASFKIHVTEGLQDLHSGEFGGLAYNSSRALVDILSRLKDTDNNILVPGFYDNVIDLTGDFQPDTSTENLSEFCKSNLGFEPKGNKKGISLNKSGTIEPTLEINGIHGGYTGPGFKTVIPCTSTAYLSCRIIPKQDPLDVVNKVILFLKNQLPDTLSLSYEIESLSHGWITSKKHPLIPTLTSIFSELYEQPCKCISIGGSIPIAPLLAQVSGTDPIIIGVSYLSDNIHGMNENFSITQLQKGFCSIYNLIKSFHN